MRNLFRTNVVVLAVAFVLPLGGCAETGMKVGKWEKSWAQKKVDKYKETMISAEQGDANARKIMCSKYRIDKWCRLPQKKVAKTTISNNTKSAEDQYQLGGIYYYGRGVTQNYVTAAKWFRLAAEQGDRDAQYFLGNMYKNGQGLPQDNLKAAIWYKSATDKGHKPAQQKLAELNIRMSQVATIASPKSNAASPAIPKDQIWRIQETLAQLGYKPGIPDGRMGKITRQAISAFQRESGTTVDGKATSQLLAKLDQAVAKSTRQSSSKVTPFEKQITDALSSKSKISQPLSIEEIGSVRQQVAKCWNPPAMDKNAAEKIIEIAVGMNIDGTVRDARISNRNLQSDPFLRAVAESALRAVLNRRCQPFKLPREKFDRWKTITLIFSDKDTVRASTVISDVPLSTDAAKATQSRPTHALIRKIQEQLVFLGYEPGTQDGQMGDNTRQAIRAFQQRNEMKVDGEATSKLLARLVRAVARNTIPPSPKAASLPKPSIPAAIAQDTTPPSIDIAANITVKTASPTIRGRAMDNERVAQVTVEDRAVELQEDGTFSFTRYVPTSGTTVQIEAIDEWGNRSQKTVHLTRTITDTSDQITFASLDPTKINGRNNRNAVALIIGVADYTRAPAAVYADSDASVFSDYARRALGIPRSSIKVLTNDNASLTDLKLNVKQWLRGRIEKGRTDVYVFYAGHGLASSDGEDLYLLPHDGVPSLLEDTSLQRNELFDVIAAANPKSATIFLDTCYSGLSRGDETLLASARPILITAKHQAAPEGFTVFSAASGLQISSGLDEAKHGLFSYYLMRGMEGDADANADRAITAGELHAYVLKNVKRQAVRLGREQVPELSGDVDRVLVRW
jgi:peptidoglycan hydrolase-like protein with peptidoglycan-binding domain